MIVLDASAALELLLRTDAGKALGMPSGEIDRLAKSFAFWDQRIEPGDGEAGRVLEIRVPFAALGLRMLRPA